MSEVVKDDNPYSRLMALKKMGIVENYAVIYSFILKVNQAKNCTYCWCRRNWFSCIRNADSLRNRKTYFIRLRQSLTGKYEQTFLYSNSSRHVKSPSSQINSSISQSININLSIQHEHHHKLRL